MSWTGLRMTGGPVKGMYGDCGGGSSRRLGSNPDRPCGLLDPCASKGACTGLRGPLVQQCTGGYPVKCPRIPVPSGGHRLGKAGRVNQVKLPSMRRHTNPWKTDCRPGAGLAAEKRQVPGGDYVLPGWIPPPRRKGDAHPGRISMARNIAIPSGVRRLATCGNPTVRKGQAPSGDRSAQEAKAGSSRQGRRRGDDCGGSKDIGKTAPILLPPAVAPLAWPRPVARGMTVSRIRVLVARPARALT